MQEALVHLEERVRLDRRAYPEMTAELDQQVVLGRPARPEPLVSLEEMVAMVNRGIMVIRAQTVEMAPPALWEQQDLQVLMDEMAFPDQRHPQALMAEQAPLARREDQVRLVTPEQLVRPAELAPPELVAYQARTEIQALPGLPVEQVLPGQ